MISLQSELVRLAPSAPDLVWFSGEDARSFLNDLISQEIGDLGPGEVRRSFLLEPQGKLMFLLKVFVGDDRIGLLTDQGRGEDLAAALSRYRIRVDVEIEVDETPRWVVVGDCEGIDISWPGVKRCLVFDEPPQMETISPEEYERMRIEHGIPAWGFDVDESTIPHESGLVPMSVDFTKGCFLGQELVARIDSRGGNVPRHLRRLESQIPLSAGDDAKLGDRLVGTVTSASGTVGLGMIHRDVALGDVVQIGDGETVVKDLHTEISG